MFTKGFAKLLLKLSGWTIIGQPPKVDKCVYIFAPHTSNWDFVSMLLLKWAANIKPKFIGKHTLFKAPHGWFFRMIGGEPVDRTRSTNVVDQIVELFNTRRQFYFALSPEGTRSKTNHWKTGFYWVAVKAEVPIQLTFLDRPSKTIGFGPLLMPCGDVEKDYQFLENFYLSKKGFRPDLMSDIRINGPTD